MSRFTFLIIFIMSTLFSVSIFGGEIYSPKSHKPIFKFDVGNKTVDFTNKNFQFPKKGQITTIFFDAGGVLTNDLLPPLRKYLAEKFKKDGITLDEIKDAAAQVTRYKADMGFSSDAGYHRDVLLQAFKNNIKYKDLSDSDIFKIIDRTINWINWQNTISEIIKNNSSCITPVIELAEQLKQNGYNVGVISDDSYEMGRARISAYPNVFPEKNIFISAFSHTKKPHEQIYKIALSKSGLANTPGKAVFIDNKPYNIYGYPNDLKKGCGATGVGMWGILFKGEIELPSGEKAKGEPIQNLYKCLEKLGISVRKVE
jgi:FMN phosphatase YigB (HAD superfamily)